jgi:protein TonB
LDGLFGELSAGCSRTVCERFANRAEAVKHAGNQALVWPRVMLQVVMANPGNPAIPAMRYRRGLIVLGAVIGAHLVLLFVATTTRDKVVEQPVEPLTITAMLLSPEPEPPKPAAPAAAVSPPAPAATPPVAHAKPEKPAKPLAQVLPRSRASHSAASVAPASPKVSQASQAPIAPLTPPENAAPPATAQPAPAAPTPSPAAPATTPSAASSAPKTVPHIDCTIPKPDYPDISKRRRENGTAIVRFVVGLTGRIDTMQLQQSSGYPRLDEAALAAVHASVCQPYSENGTVIRAAYSQSFVFGLTD